MSEPESSAQLIKNAAASLTEAAKVSKNKFRGQALRNLAWCLEKFASARSSDLELYLPEGQRSVIDNYSGRIHLYSHSCPSIVRVSELTSEDKPAPSNPAWSMRETDRGATPWLKDADIPMRDGQVVRVRTADGWLRAEVDLQQTDSSFIPRILPPPTWID